MSGEAWWKWQGRSTIFPDGDATYFIGTANEVTVHLPKFRAALALATAIENQCQVARQDARAGLLSAISRIEP